MKFLVILEVTSLPKNRILAHTEDQNYKIDNFERSNIGITFHIKKFGFSFRETHLNLLKLRLVSHKIFIAQTIPHGANTTLGVL